MKGGPSGEKKGSACEEKCASESNPKPRPKHKPSYTDVAELLKRRSLDGCALIGKPVCERGVCVRGGGISVLRTHVLEQIVLLGCWTVCVLLLQDLVGVCVYYCRT